MVIGDLVIVRGTAPIGADPPEKVARGWRDYPGEYAFHTYVWVPGGTVGTLLELRGSYLRVLLQGHLLWLENSNIEQISHDDM